MISEGNKSRTCWSKLLVIALVLALLFPAIPQMGFASDSILINDDFSGYEPGVFTVGSGNSWAKLGSTNPDITIVKDTVTGRTYASMVNNTGSGIYVGQSFSSQSSGMVMEFDANFPTDLAGNLWVRTGSLSSSNLATKAGLAYSFKDKEIKVRETQNVLLTYDTSHWYRFTITFHIPNQTYEIKVTDLDTGMTVRNAEKFYSTTSTNNIPNLGSFAFLLNSGGGTINLTNVRITSASVDTPLSHLQLDADGFTPILEPAFDPAVAEYNVQVPFDTKKIYVTPTASIVGKVELKVGEEIVASGEKVSIPIVDPSTRISIYAVNTEYNIERTYTIQVTQSALEPLYPDLNYIVTESHDSKVKIGWEEPADESYLAARIYMLNDGQDPTLVDTVTKGTYISTINGLANGTLYSFLVKGLYEGGFESPGVQVAETPVKLAPRQMERLNRGLVAIQNESGVYLSWRLLGTDPQNIAFNIYREGVRINSVPLTESTNIQDVGGNAGSTYFIRTVVNGVEQEQSETATVWNANYLRVPIRKPDDGVTVTNEVYSYRANDATVADLDGDGEYEIVLKWDPTNSQDNSKSGYTGSTKVDAYKLDGTFLWRIDIGRNIRAGAHYTDIMVYDFDGDGKAEVTFRTSDGTVDGQGNVIGDPDVYYANEKGHIITGNEYHTIFEGTTGKVLANIPYEPERGDPAGWGDADGNRSERFLAAVAYLDGERPSIITQRGYYRRMVLVAYDWRDGELTKRWTFDTNEPENASYFGQGNHQLSVADLDGDGRDEIITGPAAIDDDGTGLWSSGLGHGDAMHVSDLNPNRLGMEIWAVQENKSSKYSADMKDGKTGRVLWGELQLNKDIGRGLSADVDPRYPGHEAWAISGAWNGTAGGMYSADGQKISDNIPSSNFAIYWDGDLGRELLDHDWVTTPSKLGTLKVDKWDYENAVLKNLATFSGTASNNDTKGNPALQADLLGDWREEVMVRDVDSTELRIYSTTDVTDYRFVTLMHDPVYRLGVAWQNTGYNQPPHLSYYLGYGMEQPEAPNIRTNTVPAQALTIYAPEFEVGVGGQLRLFPVITPSAAYSENVSWTVAQLDGASTPLARVDEHGILTATGPGVVKVTAVLGDGSGLSASEMVTITGGPSSVNADLSWLSVSEAEIAPAFDPAITEYTATVPYNTASVRILASAADVEATFTINDVQTSSGTEQEVQLEQAGDTTAVIVVTAGSGAIKTYTLTIKRQSQDAIEEETDSTEHTGSSPSNSPAVTPPGSSSTSRLELAASDIVNYRESGTGKIVVETSSVSIPAEALLQSNGNTLVLKTPEAGYQLPLHAIDLPKLANILGAEASKVRIEVEIVNASGKSNEIARGLILTAGGVVVGDGFDFIVAAEAEGRRTALSDYGNVYVERSIVLDEGINPGEVHAVMFDPGAQNIRFVPAVIRTVNGKQEATIFRTGNSLYYIVKGKRTFDDIANHWAKTDIEQLASAWLLDGTGQGKYEPDQALTRAQLTALIVRSLGLSEKEGTSAFTDVAKDAWYAGAIEAAREKGLVDGAGNGRFNPEGAVTREEMAVLALRAAAFAGRQEPSPKADLTTFTDFKEISRWASDDVSAAAGAGLVQGRDNSLFLPKEPVTRAEAAVILKRLLLANGFIHS